MRKTTMTMIAAATLGFAALIPASGSAFPSAVAPVASPEAVRTVQYWGTGPQFWNDGWERRRQWREWRQQRDAARISEVARREAWRIEQEREQHRAWWRTQRGQQYGYTPGYHRSW